MGRGTGPSMGLMNDLGSKACEAWLSEHGEGLPWGQVVAHPCPNGWELRHVADAGRDAAGLQALPPGALREWADTADDGLFRPLKSAPTLRRGWRCLVSSHDDLELALGGVYPGGLGDWWAVRTGQGGPTSFREFMGRQTGVYRGVRGLADEAARAVVRACCHAGSCIKDRRWAVEGMVDGEPGGHGSIPCLEPCALVLEAARTMARMASLERTSVALSGEDLAVLRAALERASALRPPPGTREAELSAPDNPRRMKLLLEWLGPEWARPAASPQE